MTMWIGRLEGTSNVGFGVIQELPELRAAMLLLYSGALGQYSSQHLSLQLQLPRVSSAATSARLALHRMVIELARRDPICKRLMTAPGVGPVVALTYRTVIDNPARFAESEERRHPSRAEAKDILIRRRLANGSCLAKRRRQPALSDVRGCPGPDDGTRQMVFAQGLGCCHRAPAWHSEGARCRRSAPCCDPAPHVSGWHRFPMGQGAWRSLNTASKPSKGYRTLDFPARRSDDRGDGGPAKSWKLVRRRLAERAAQMDPPAPLTTS